MGSHTEPFKATINVKDVANPEGLVKALLPEMSSERKFFTEISIEDKEVVIRISSNTPTGLRAGVNTYLRILMIIEGIDDSILKYPGHTVDG